MEAIREISKRKQSVRRSQGKKEILFRGLWMQKFVKSWIHKLGRWYCEEICRSEYESQAVTAVNERPVEYRFVFQSLLRTSPTTVLDVGTGTTALPHVIRTCGHMVTATDNTNDYWPIGMFNRHCYVVDDDITKTRIAKTFDLITCVSVLEHIKNHTGAIQGMFALLNSGGHLALTFPYNENQYIEDVYKLPGPGYRGDAPYVTQVYSRHELGRWLKTINGRIVEQEYWQVWTGDVWRSGERQYPPRQVDKHEMHQLTCLLIQKQ